MYNDSKELFCYLYSMIKYKNYTQYSSCLACDRVVGCFLFLLSVFVLQSSLKVFKRHSSIIPSSHLLTEVQERMPSLDGSDFEPGQYCHSNR